MTPTEQEPGAACEDQRAARTREQVCGQSFTLGRTLQLERLGLRRFALRVSLLGARHEPNGERRTEHCPTRAHQDPRHDATAPHTCRGRPLRLSWSCRRGLCLARAVNGCGRFGVLRLLRELSAQLIDPALHVRHSVGRRICEKVGFVGLRRTLGFSVGLAGATEVVEQLGLGMKGIGFFEQRRCDRVTPRFVMLSTLLEQLHRPRPSISG